MADQIYTTQTPNTEDFDALTHHLGPLFSVSANRNVVGGRAWVPTAGRPATFFWQLWRVSDTTLIAECDLNTLPPPSAGAWMSFTSADFSTPGNVAIVSTDTYIVCLFYGANSNFNYLTSFTYPITNGVLTATAGRFNTGSPQATFPASTDSGNAFFADVTVDVDSVTGILSLLIPALDADADGEVTASGVLNLNLPPLDAQLDGEVTASGVLNATLPPLAAELDGEVTASGVLNPNLPALVAELDGELSTSGTLSLVIPALEVDEVGLVTVEGSLNVVLPALDVELDGQLPVSGVLNIVLPALQADLTGNSAAGGATMGPCGWTIPDPLCCPDWAGTDAAIKSAAADYAATILWAATGRQFGLCEVTVRPCGMRRCSDGSAEFWGYDWSGGTWTPYVFNGQWFNCGCGAGCTCEPSCQVRLMGPVNSIVEVTIGGIAVDPDTYRVDDNHWLVRTAGECWPQCADLDTDDGDNVFEVTYMRGDPVPNALLRAASTVECEWAKACNGGDCRLSNRVTSVARSGITIDMVDPNQLLESGLTGMWEVDTVIRAFNPDRLNKRLKIWAPELNVPRTVTSP